MLGSSAIGLAWTAEGRLDGPEMLLEGADQVG
jgi:hypothetical protein